MKNQDALKKLIRVKSLYLETRQKYVGKLLGRVVELEESIESHAATLKEERTQAYETLEGMQAFAEYQTSIRQKIERLSRVHQEAQAQLRQEQDKLKTLYADIKIHQTLLARAAQDALRQREKKDQEALDDLYASKMRGLNLKAES